MMMHSTRSCLHAFANEVHMSVAQYMEPVEAVRVAVEILRRVLVTDDLSIRRLADACANRIARDVTSYMKREFAVRSASRAWRSGAHED